jgi:hypothetical protein
LTTLYTKKLRIRVGKQARSTYILHKQQISENVYEWNNKSRVFIESDMVREQIPVALSSSEFGAIDFSSSNSEITSFIFFYMILFQIHKNSRATAMLALLFCVSDNTKFCIFLQTQ